MKPFIIADMSGNGLPPKYYTEVTSGGFIAPYSLKRGKPLLKEDLKPQEEP